MSQKFTRMAALDDGIYTGDEDLEELEPSTGSEEDTDTSGVPEEQPASPPDDGDTYGGSKEDY